MAPIELPFTKDDQTTGTLSDYAGSWVVLYFYPKDNTPGCTLEAEGFRDAHEAFAERSAVVLGVSKDSCTSHVRFIEKKELNFTLVADTEHVLMEAFGTWMKKKMMGREYMGTSRSTFLLDPTGRVAYVWEAVSPGGHPEEVIAKLDELLQDYKK